MEKTYILMFSDNLKKLTLQVYKDFLKTNMSIEL